MKKLLAAVAATVAITAGTLAVTTGPAAAVRDGTCDAGDVCLWDNYPGGGGGFVAYDGAVENYGNQIWYGFYNTIDNAVSGLGNHGRSKYIRAFKNAGYSGAYHNYPNNSVDYIVGENSAGVYFNNTFSSHYWYTN